jgi:hypothetical protein
MKYLRNLRFEPLFSEGLRFPLEESTHQEHLKNKQIQIMPVNNWIDKTLCINAHFQVLIQAVRH